MGRSVTLTISDYHAPFHNSRALKFLRQLKKEFHPTRIVCLGDVVDLYRLSRFVCDPSTPGIEDEIKNARLALKALYSVFPEVFMTIGNHDTRFLRQGFTAGVSNAFLKRIEEVLECPRGWHLRDSFEFDDVFYFHGEPFTSGSWMQAGPRYRQSVVMGHVHSNGGVVYSKAPSGHQIFTLNAGCLIDEKAYAFRYGKNCTSKPTIGTGVVLDRGRRGEFIPLL